MEFNFKISKSFILLVDDINGISAQPGCLAVLDILDFDLNRDLIGDLNTRLIGDLNRDLIGDLNTRLIGDLNRDLIGDLNRDLIGDLNTRFIPSGGDRPPDIFLLVIRVRSPFCIYILYIHYIIG